MRRAFAIFVWCVCGAATVFAQHPALPDFCAAAPDPLSVAAGQSRTVPAGATTASCLRVLGELVLADNAKLRVTTLHVRSGGTLRCASATCTGVELTIRDVPSTDTNADAVFGHRVSVGLLGEGIVTLAGSPVTGFVRLSSEPQAGATTLALAATVDGWQAGDQLVIPDSREDISRQNDAQLERRTIASIAADRRSVTLNAPLSFRHPGARDHTGAIVLLPHVMNVSRRVVIRSENPAGTRGHVLFTGRATVDVRHVEFRDLGRTTISPLNASSNPAGRYALHFHHLLGPTQTPTNGYQFTAIGNALHDTNAGRSRIKWPLAIHNSHYGLVQDNVVYNAGGAGIVTEDGNESYNVIERNMVARVTGNGDRNGHKEGGVQEAGSQGIGFWFHGPNNYVRNNVAANATENTDEAGYGFELYQEHVGDVRIPTAKGADTYTTRSVYTMPVLEFSGNEAYGNPQGMTYWWVGMEYHATRTTSESVFRDFRIWHSSRYPIYGYQGAKITFDGLQVYGDMANIGECCRRIWWSDYLSRDLTIRRATVTGIASLTLPYAVQGTTTVEDSFFATASGIVNVTSGASGDCPGCSFPNRRQNLRNLRFAALPGRSLRTITMQHETHDGHADLASADDTYVYAYQGQAGSDFRTYYRERSAPCSTTRPEIVGFVCGATPGPNVDCQVSAFGPWTNTGSPSACNATTGLQQQLQTRTRTVTQQQSGNGQACPALTETQTIETPCAVACVVGDWTDWQGTSAWTPDPCTSGTQQARQETRTRPIVTPPLNGGTVCPVLSESRTAMRSCATPPPVTEILVEGTIATDPIPLPSPGGLTVYVFIVVTEHGGVLFQFPGLRIPGAVRDLMRGDFVDFMPRLNPNNPNVPR